MGGPRRGRARAAAPRRRRDHPRPRAVHRRRRPGDAAPGRDPPRAALHHPDGEDLAQAMDLGVRTWGNEPGRLDDDAHRHLPDARRDQPAAARGAAPAAGPAGGRLGLSPRPAARRRDRQGRARPGGGSRPAARPAAHRRPAGLVLPPGGRGAGLVPGPRRPRGGQGPADAAQQPGPPLDRGHAGRGGRRVPRGSGPPVHRTGRRAADGVPHRLAAGHWPPTCCASRTPPSARWPTQVGYGSPSPSAPPSSACAASARRSTAWGHPRDDPRPGAVTAEAAGRSGARRGMPRRRSGAVSRSPSRQGLSRSPNVPAASSP